MGLKALVDTGASCCGLREGGAAQLGLELIGRDVLDQAILVYHGPRKTFSLSFWTRRAARPHGPALEAEKRVAESPVSKREIIRLRPLLAHELVQVPEGSNLHPWPDAQHLATRYVARRM